MFSTSNDILHLAIALAVLVVSGYLSYMFYHLANLAKESQKSVEHVNTQLDRVDSVMDEVIPTVQSINGTVRHIHESLIPPIDTVLGFLKRLTHFNKDKE